MTRRNDSRYRPQFDVLEDRALPSSLGGLKLVLVPPPHHPGGAPPAHHRAPAAHGHRHAATHPLKLDDPNGDQGNPGVLPPNSHAFGTTYSDLSAAQWQYLYAIPASQNPAEDTTGADFTVGQSGKVWFLTGTFCPTTQGVCDTAHPATVTRNVTLHTGKALFLPIIDAEFDNLNTTPGTPGYGTQNLGFSVADLRAQAKAAIDAVASMDAEIDGQPVHNLQNYRVTSPVFRYHLAANGIQGAGIPEQDVSPAVSDGYFLLLAPLSAGAHTIHFAASVPSFNFALDVTYHITVKGG
jgi:hypothetical protein